MTDYQFLDRDVALSCIDELINLLSTSSTSSSTTTTTTSLLLLTNETITSNFVSATITTSVDNDNNNNNNNNSSSLICSNINNTDHTNQDDNQNQQHKVQEKDHPLLLLLDRTLEKIRTIFDKYLECPTLLDGSIQYIVQMISKPILIHMNQLLQLRNATTTIKTDHHSITITTTKNDTTIHLQQPQQLLLLLRTMSYLFSILYTLCKVRGSKCIQKFLSHNVDDLEPVWYTLQQFLLLYHHHQQQQTTETQSQAHQQQSQQQLQPPLWESIYVLWNWMAILSFIPFDVHKIIQNNHNNSSSSSSSFVLPLPSSVLPIPSKEQQQLNYDRNDSININNEEQLEPKTKDIEKQQQQQQQQQVEQETNFMTHLMTTCFVTFSDPGPIREAASVCLASWLARPDPLYQSYYVSIFLQFAIQNIHRCTKNKNQNLNKNDSNSDSSSSNGGSDNNTPPTPLLGEKEQPPLTPNVMTPNNDVNPPIHTPTAMPTTIRTTTASSGHDPLFLTLGILETCTRIMKISNIDRHVLLSYLEPFWDPIIRLADGDDDDDDRDDPTRSTKNTTTSSSSNNKNLLVQRLFVKWWTRMSCLYLPPKIAKWRYQRGKRTLGSISNKAGDDQEENKICTTNNQNVSTTVTSIEITKSPLCVNQILSNEEKKIEVMKHENHNDDDDENEYLEIVPDRVEDAMDRILNALAHTSTIVRWSAAKGIGRITERLPKLCGEDVLDAILLYFQEYENDRCWHGACLALAELARRGMLLPHRLSDVVPYIVRAIQYDIQKGHTSVGSHVRDAGCYTYWAFARSYHPQILYPYLNELNDAIILTSLFDREVNCRRAASAAFQEAVGRQSAINFEHGIDIITTADYFSLGNRTDSYLCIAYTIAKFDKYRKPIIDHLYQCKLFHWDINIRTLSSKALRKMTDLHCEYFGTTVLEILLEKCLDERNLFIRHGATLGIAEILQGLSDLKQIPFISDTNKVNLMDLVSKIEKKRLYRGRGGEIMRAAVCRLIESLCTTQLPMTVKEQVYFLDIIDTNLPHPNETIQTNACIALNVLLSIYFPVGTLGPSTRLQNRVVDKFVTLCLQSENPAITRGYTLALGYLPAKLVAPTTEVLTTVLSCLAKMAHMDSLVGGESDAETRRNSLFSLIRIIDIIQFGGDPLDDVPYPLVPFDVTMILVLCKVFILAMGDYKSDKRGDVGSWCRIAGMKGIVSLLIAVEEHHSSCHNDKIVPTSLIDVSYHHNPYYATVAVSICLKLAMEKLDTVRIQAGMSLVSLLMTKSGVSGIVKKEQLIKQLELSTTTTTTETLSWDEPSAVFPRVIRTALLADDEDNDDSDYDDEPLYFKHVILGIVSSIGGLTEAISTVACSVLIRWAKSGGNNNNNNSNQYRRQERLGYYLVQLLQDYCGTDLLVLPILKTLDKLLVHKCLDVFIKIQTESPDHHHHHPSSFCFTLLERLRMEEKVSHTKDMKRLFSIITVTHTLLLAIPPMQENEHLIQKGLSFLCNIMLLHPYPNVRSYTAEQMYLFLIGYHHNLNHRHHHSTTVVVVDDTKLLQQPQPQNVVVVDDINKSRTAALDLLLNTPWSSNSLKQAQLVHYSSKLAKMIGLDDNCCTK